MLSIFSKRKKENPLPSGIEKILVKNGFVYDDFHHLHKVLGEYGEVTMFISWKRVDERIFINLDCIQIFPVNICGEDKKMKLSFEHTVADQNLSIEIFEKLQQDIAAYYKKMLKEEMEDE